MSIAAGFRGGGVADARELHQAEIGVRLYPPEAPIESVAVGLRSRSSARGVSLERPERPPVDHRIHYTDMPEDRRPFPPDPQIPPLDLLAASQNVARVDRFRSDISGRQASAILREEGAGDRKGEALGAGAIARAQRDAGRAVRAIDERGAIWSLRFPLPGLDPGADDRDMGRVGALSRGRPERRCQRPKQKQTEQRQCSHFGFPPRC